VLLTRRTICARSTAAKDHTVWRERVTYLREAPTSEKALQTARTLAGQAEAEGLPVFVMEVRVGRTCALGALAELTP
jgi:hypothetical protein